MITLLPFNHIRDIHQLDHEMENEINNVDLAGNLLPEAHPLLQESRQRFSIPPLNSKSISSTFSQFESMLKTHEFDLITLSET